MNKGVNSAVKGIAAGMLVGTVAYMAGQTKKSTGKQIKKNVTKVMHTMGDVFHNISYMM